jgi:PDZ domain-containing secreted protein
VKEVNMKRRMSWTRLVVVLYALAALATLLYTIGAPGGGSSETQSVNMVVTTSLSTGR